MEEGVEGSVLSRVMFSACEVTLVCVGGGSRGLDTGGRRDTPRGSGFFFFFLTHRQTYTGHYTHMPL